MNPFTFRSTFLRKGHFQSRHPHAGIIHCLFSTKVAADADLGDAPTLAGSSSDSIKSENGCCQRIKDSAFFQASVFKTPTRPDLDFDFLLSEANLEFLEMNCQQRKNLGDARRMHSIWAQLQQFAPFSSKSPPSSEHLRTLWDQLYTEAAKLPNISDLEAPIGDEAKARVIEHFGGDKRQQEGLLTAEHLIKDWRVLKKPAQTGGSQRSYALVGTLADLERALLDHAFEFIYNRLQEEEGVNGLEVIQVDDILPVSTTRACGLHQGLSTHPIQYRVFHAHEVFGPKDDNVGIKQLDFSETHPRAYCLSGTAEMGIAERIKGRIFDESQLPCYFLAESACFRPEIASGALEGGLYRVHEFKKIEMFVVCTERQSSAELQRLVRIQKDLLSSLQFHCRLLDMPTEELGAPATRKFDIETWMPGRRKWGELTSASNCTDYQARRLHIKYRSSQENPVSSSTTSSLRYVHTCNGTGLSSARALIALLETSQKKLKGIELPTVVKQRMPTERSAVYRATKVSRKNS